MEICVDGHVARRASGQRHGTAAVQSAALCRGHPANHERNLWQMLVLSAETSDPWRPIGICSTEKPRK